MQSASSLEARIKCRLHDAIVAVIVPPVGEPWKSAAMRQATRDKTWTRQKLHRLVAGPLNFPFAIDNLARIADHLGYDVHDDGTCVPRGARQPATTAGVPLAA